MLERDTIYLEDNNTKLTPTQIYNKINKLASERKYQNKKTSTAPLSLLPPKTSKAPLPLPPPKTTQKAGKKNKKQKQKKYYKKKTKRNCYKK